MPVLTSEIISLKNCSCDAISCCFSESISFMRLMLAAMSGDVFCAERLNEPSLFSIASSSMRLAIRDDFSDRNNDAAGMNAAAMQMIPNSHAPFIYRMVAEMESRAIAAILIAMIHEK